MSAIFFLLEWLAYPLYILIGVIIAWYLWQFLQVSSERRATYFELERDLLRQRQFNAVTVIIVMLELVVLVVGVQLRAVPYLETERDLDEVALQAEVIADDILFVTDTPPPPGAGGLDLEVGTPLGIEADLIVLTPTLTPTPVGTIQPNPPPIEGCIDSRAMLEIPANGMRVFEPLVVRGSASVPDFTKATLEIAGPRTDGQYVVLDSIINPVTQMSDFSQFSPGQYISDPGLYEFRLMVFDLSNQPVASCKVNIYISEPPNAATATPPAGS